MPKFLTVAVLSNFISALDGSHSTISVVFICVLISPVEVSHVHPGHSPEPQLVVLTSGSHVDGASDPPKKPYDVQSCKGNDSPSVRPKTVATSPLVAAAHFFIWFSFA